LTVDTNFMSSTSQVHTDNRGNKLANQKELDEAYMGTAILHARMSKARRSKVGACLVTRNGVCLTGFNGTPIGLPNNCENEVSRTYNVLTAQDEVILETKPEVIHAELNCIMKAAREGVSCLGGTMYVTLSPCVPCAAMMINAGIVRLVYKELYRDSQGIDKLKEGGIIVETFKGDLDEL